jgi:hypothetical protein
VTAPRALLGCVAALIVLVAAIARAEPPLVLERTIPLPNVRGRIDHMALDRDHARLFVAALGDGTVEVVDLHAGTISGRIEGLREPQGVAYVPQSDRVVVACGGDGTVRIFGAGDLSPVAQVGLGDDADDARIDPRDGRVLVGYGSGGLAILDPAHGAKLTDVALPEHPEGFELDTATDRVFVNLPTRGEIAVVDLRDGRPSATWRVLGARSNFPLAIDGAGALLATVFRKPPKLALLDAQTGAVKADAETCGDADDVFFDGERSRIYVSCGEGVVDVFAFDASGVRRLARVATAPGGRTSLFAPALDRLFVAVRAGGGAPASILVFRPVP